MANRRHPTTRGRRRTEEVAEILRREIVTGLVAGSIAVGDPLPPESDLLTRFDLSRPTLREAMRLLESEGVVEFRVGQAGGAFIVEPETDLAARRVATMLQLRGTTVADVWRLRGELTCVAVRLVAAQPSAATIEGLREQAASAVGPDIEPPQPRSALPFDDAVVAAAGNDTLAVLWGVLREIVMRQAELVTRTFAAEQSPELTLRRNRALSRAVAKVVDLIESGDPEEAEAFWRLQVAAIERIMRDQMGDAVLTQPIDASW